MNKTKKTLVILTNIPTPYRIAFFNVLYQKLLLVEIDFHVLFCAETEPNRHWKIQSGDFKFPFVFMRGIQISFKSFFTHVNPGVVSHLKKLNPTWLLIAGAWNTPTMIIASRKYFIKNTKTIFWSEGHDEAVLHPTGVIASLRRYILKSFDGYAVPNQRSEAYINKSTNKISKFIRLPNTIDDTFYNFNADLKIEGRKLLNIGDQTKVIVQVSQLENKKGISELIDAFQSLPEKYAGQCLLVIVGTGSLIKSAQKKVALSPRKNVILAGHCEKSEVKKWLQIADIFILATKLDPNPLTPIEASFMRLPIILSIKAGNYNEILFENINGTGIFEISENGIKEKLISMLNLDKDKLEQMGEFSLKNAGQNFGCNSVAATFIDQLIRF